MATLSLVGATLITKYKAHACTDVTGFGILGHANYLAQAQRNPVDLVIRVLPIYKNLLKIEHKAQTFGILEGTAAETSGGLLICLPQEVKRRFMEELAASDINCWEIGYVREGSRKAVF
ncbi:unnamed protein product [Sphagnum balticum]